VDERERDQVLTKLRETRDGFLSSVQGIGEKQAVWKPAPERWSALECAEHVAIVEKRMFNRLTAEVMPRVGGSAGVGREQTILDSGADRSRKFQAPPAASPSGTFTTIEEAVEAFRMRRFETMRWVENCREELRAMQTNHPAFGEITAQECLALLIIHPARHALQVHELRQHPQFPR
jgi:hypothetical protein